MVCTLNSIMNFRSFVQRALGERTISYSLRKAVQIKHVIKIQ